MRTMDILQAEQKVFISKLMNLLRTDPTASEHALTYRETEEYLWELLDKNDSVLEGLIVAMEHYLEK